MIQKFTRVKTQVYNWISVKACEELANEMEINAKKTIICVAGKKKGAKWIDHISLIIL